MGINSRRNNLVIKYGLPSDVHNYFQMAQRGGRGGDDALSVLLTEKGYTDLATTKTADEKMLRLVLSILRPLVPDKQRTNAGFKKADAVLRELFKDDPTFCAKLAQDPTAVPPPQCIRHSMKYFFDSIPRADLDELIQAVDVTCCSACVSVRNFGPYHLKKSAHPPPPAPTPVTAHFLSADTKTAILEDLEPIVAAKRASTGRTTRPWKQRIPASLSKDVISGNAAWQLLRGTGILYQIMDREIRGEVIEIIRQHVSDNYQWAKVDKIVYAGFCDCTPKQKWGASATKCACRLYDKTCNAQCTCKLSENCANKNQLQPAGDQPTADAAPAPTAPTEPEAMDLDNQEIAPAAC